MRSKSIFCLAGRLVMAWATAAVAGLGFAFLLGSPGTAAPLPLEFTDPEPVTLTVEGLAAPAAGLVPFTVTVRADFSDTQTMLRYRMGILSAGDPLVGQTFYYPEPGDPLDDPTRWHTFTTDIQGEAFWGPPDGFSLEQLPELRAGLSIPFWTHLGVGAYSLTVNLEELTGTVRGSRTQDFIIRPAAVLEGGGIAACAVSGWIPFSVGTRVTETGGISSTLPLTVFLRYQAEFYRDGAALADQVVYYPEPEDDPLEPSTWHSFTTDAAGIAWFGPPTGFRLSDLITLTEGLTTPFRSDLAAGVYSLTVRLMDITMGPAVSVVLGADIETFGIASMPVLQFETSTGTVSEGGGTAAIPAMLGSPHCKPVSVDYVAIDGTATAGSDYDSATGTLVFSAGEQHGGILVSIVADSLAEGEETLRLALHSPVDAVLGTPATLTLAIVDDDFVLAADTVGNGRVMKFPDRITYPSHEGVTLTALADPGWAFAGWSGSLTTTDNPAAFAITGNMGVTATFVQYRSYLPLILRHYPPTWRRGAGTEGLLFYTPKGCGAIEYAGSEKQGIWKSNDRSQSWVPVDSGGMATVDPAIADPGNCSRFFAAGWGKGVYQSDRGYINAGLGENYLYGLIITDTLLYAGSNSRGIYRMRVGGSTWEAAGLNDKPIRALYAVGNALYAGSRACTIYRRPDGGSFDSGRAVLTDGCDNAQVWSLLKVQNTLYAGLGLEKGLYSASAAGGSFSRVTAVPARTIYGLAYAGPTGFLYVSIYGAGVYRCTLNREGGIVGCLDYSQGLGTRNVRGIEFFDGRVVVGSDDGLWYLEAVP